MLYRPSYKFCRENNREKMLLYINEKLKEFKKVDKPAAFISTKRSSDQV